MKQSEDEKEIIAWQKGVVYGKEHSEPSPVTKEFMTKVEMEISTIKEKLEKMPTKDEMALCIEKAVDTALEKAEKRFAAKIELENTNKNVEKIQGDIRWVVYTIIGTLIVGVISFIYFR